MVRLCFVCLGNICRSPTAEGIMLQLVEQAGLAAQFTIDSAGTGDYHVGERPDRRTLETARARGVDLPSRARQWQTGDFAHFDLVLAMDPANRDALLRLAPDDEARAKVCSCAASIPMRRPTQRCPILTMVARTGSRKCSAYATPRAGDCSRTCERRIG